MQILSAASAFHVATEACCVVHWRSIQRSLNPALMRRLQRDTELKDDILTASPGLYQLATWGETNNLSIQTAVEWASSRLPCLESSASGAARSRSLLFYVRHSSFESINRRTADQPAFGSPRHSPHSNVRAGCVAGAAGISRRLRYVKAHPSQLAVLLSVELCSLTLQREDLHGKPDLGRFVGDGAAA